MKASEMPELNYSLDRDQFNDMFHTYLIKMGLEDEDGYDERYYRGFENGTFYIRAYYWGECSCGGDTSEMTSPELHDAECLIYKPNFIYTPKNFILTWYKHPLRGNACNKELTMEQFKAMMEDCVRSMEI